MKKATRLNTFVLIVNIAMIAINHFERQTIEENQTETIVLLEIAQEDLIKAFSDNFPSLPPDDLKKAFKEGRQYEGDEKKMKQFWSDKQVEWKEKSIALNLAANKVVNLGLSDQECFTKYGQPKSIITFEFYILYEFYTDDDIIIKIYVEKQTMTSFCITYIGKKEFDIEVPPPGATFRYCHYTKGNFYFLTVWINSKIKLIVSDRLN